VVRIKLTEKLSPANLNFVEADGVPGIVTSGEPVRAASELLCEKK